MIKLKRKGPLWQGSILVQKLPSTAWVVLLREFKLLFCIKSNENSKKPKHIKEAGITGITPGIFKPRLMKNEELQRTEKHHALGTSPLLPWTVPLLLSPQCTLNPPPVFMGRRQLPLPLFSKQVVAYMKSGQNRVSTGSFNSTTNMPWHKPTDSISAVATRKMLISNS